jgi:hypothetical protein
MIGKLAFGCKQVPHCNYSRGALIMLIFIGLAYFVLSFLTPEYHDDFVYKFVFEGAGSIMSSR